MKSGIIRHGRSHLPPRSEKFRSRREYNGPTPGESRILDESVRQQIERMPNVVEAYPDIRFITELRYDNKPHMTMVAALPSSAKSNDAFESMQGHFFSSDIAAEVVIQKTFAEELLGKTPKPGVDDTNVAQLAAPLLGKELTMRYAQRQAPPATAPAASAARSDNDEEDDEDDEDDFAGAAYSVVSRELK